MQSLISNYINGNLTEAKRQAKRYSSRRLIHGLKDYGYTTDAGAFPLHCGAGSASSLAQNLEQKT